jgi:Mg2+-importing ATPase
MSEQHGSARDPAYWSAPIERLLADLRSRADGLTSADAAARLVSVGPNTLRAESRFAALRLLARQLASPLVAILVFAAVVAALVGEWTDAAIVLAILAGSAVFGFVQEYRASAAVERLRGRIAARATVLRDGRLTEVRPEELVPGDVVALAAGSLVPADAVVIASRDLCVAQSALTGESFPVDKQPGVVPAAAALVERTNCVYQGTSVRSGSGRALVVKTGAATAYGAIADRLRLRPPETDFERGIRQYGYLLMRITILLVAAVFAVQFALARPPVEALLFALALAVGISPELLPAIIEVTLAKGAREMAGHGVIVRRLAAIEGLGAMDVLCTDKTATLTVGVMALERAAGPDGEPSDEVLREAWLNASLETGFASPLDDAIRRAVALRGAPFASAAKLDEIPYDFVRRRLGIVVREGDAARLVVKGAFADVLEICKEIRTAAGPKPLDGARRAELEARFAAWSAAGARVLGVAARALPLRERYGRDDERDLTFTGFLVFLDPPKPGIAAALEDLRRLGVAIRIVSGDNRLVNEHLCRTIGFPDPRILTGRELDALGEEALRRVAPEIDAFVEVDPNQKERVLLALKKAGHVVGYLGDGINDASALHAADVGISVDGAVDVAREAADFVLLEPDLGVLRRGIECGRASFANTLKYVSITTSANFGNMLSMAAASAFLPFLPLLAKQILLNNFLSDVPMTGLPGDRVDGERIARPGRFDVRAIRNFMVVFGLISSAFDLATFAVLWALSRGAPAVFRTGWFVESLLTELAIVLVLRTRLPIARSRPGRLLAVSTVAVAALTIALPWLPGAELFELVPLPAPVIASVLAITAAYAAASELAKRRFPVP